MKRYWYFLISAALLAGDLLSKILIKKALTDDYGEISLIPGFFKITYVENRGLIFGILQNTPMLIKAGFMLAGLALFSFYLLKHFEKLKNIEVIGFAFILGGGLGNIVDRLINGYVFDFLHLYYRRFAWPTFNLADISIDIGIVLFIIGQFAVKKNVA